MRSRRPADMLGGVRRDSRPSWSTRPAPVAVGATVAAAAMLVLNEAWNIAFFGARSTRNGFVGTVAFTGPLTALGMAVRHDPVSRDLIGIYGAWVAYDLWWSHQLWRLNPA